jgi:hypothetical protein
LMIKEVLVKEIFSYACDVALSYNSWFKYIEQVKEL